MAGKTKRAKALLALHRALKKDVDYETAKREGTLPPPAPRAKQVWHGPDTTDEAVLRARANGMHRYIRISGLGAVLTHRREPVITPGNIVEDVMDVLRDNDIEVPEHFVATPKMLWMADVLVALANDVKDTAQEAVKNPSAETRSLFLSRMADLMWEAFRIPLELGVNPKHVYLEKMVQAKFDEIPRYDKLT